MNKKLTYETDFIKSYASGRTRRDICIWIQSKLPQLSAEVDKLFDNGVIRYPFYKNKHYNQTVYGEHIEKSAYSSTPESTSDNDIRKQREKNIAKALWMLRKIPVSDGLSSGNKPLNIGIIEDYEVPLLVKNTTTLKRCIDLVSVIKSPDGLNDKIFFLELKKNNSQETLMRCILEAYTYVLFSDRKRIRQDFNVSSNAKIVICPLIFKGANNVPYKDLLALKQKDETDGGSDLMNLVNAIKKGPGLTGSESPIEFSVGVLDVNEIKLIAPRDRTGKDFSDNWLQ